MCAAERLSAYCSQQGWDAAKVLPCVLDVGVMELAMPLDKYRGSFRAKLRDESLHHDGTDLDEVTLPHSVVSILCATCIACKWPASSRFPWYESLGI